MIIAQAKQKENIIEYILYMWNVEDLVRSMNLELKAINDKIVSQYQVDEVKKAEISNWYKQIVDDMKTFGLVKQGHLPEINELITELNMLHDSLLHLYQDNTYKELEQKSKENLEELMKKSGAKNISPVEAGLNGLYGIMLLRIKQKMISEETEASVKTISELFAYLALKYNQMKAGTLSFPNERNN
jgi:hypothetical protein